MNRHIKFRAWDKTENRMREVISMDMYRHGPEHTTQYYAEGNYTNLDDVALMQFTGLTDKNGKEIYEGDVITQGRQLVTKRGEYLYKVIYIDTWGAFGVECVSAEQGEQRYAIPQAFGYEDYSPKSWSVIGNIYENPELIEKEV